jgi:hypothetical protein
MGINLGSNISVQPNYIGFISKGGGTSSIISETTTFHYIYENDLNICNTKSASLVQSWNIILYGVVILV